jgi:hypothetical protein
MSLVFQVFVIIRHHHLFLGSDCNLENLGKVSEMTGGVVDIVDPLKLKENFSNILTASKLIAT